MTSFYSTKRNHEVYVPNSRVCGYRFKNSATRSGWSSGVRADRNNGVVPQRLSRFATDDEADEKRCTVPGNTNWLNYERGGSLKFGESALHKFQVKRPAFYAGSSYVQSEEAQSINDINQRRGLGNRDITRANAMSAPVKPRQVVSFDTLQARDIEQFGQKVQLGDKTLQALMDVMIPDGDDVKWIREKMRLTALYKRRGMTDDQIVRELVVNKPLGREQRTIRGKRNIGDAALSSQSKFAEIVEEVKQGRAENIAQRSAILAHLATVLQDVAAIDTISKRQGADLSDAINRLSIPRSWVEYGFPHRVISVTDFRKQAGLYSVFLLTTRGNRPLITPILNAAGNGNIAISTLNSRLGETTGLLSDKRFKYFLDLERGKLMARSETLQLLRDNNLPAVPDITTAELNEGEPEEKKGDNELWPPLSRGRDRNIVNRWATQRGLSASQAQDVMEQMRSDPNPMADQLAEMLAELK